MDFVRSPLNRTHNRIGDTTGPVRQPGRPALRGRFKSPPNQGKAEAVEWSERSQTSAGEIGPRGSVRHAEAVL